MSCKDAHSRPVEFNRGRLGHTWMCLACGKHLRGPKLQEDEAKLLVEFFNRATAQTGNERKESTMQLEIKVLAGAESKQFLVDLTKQIDRLEKALTASAVVSAEPTAETKPAKTSKPAKAEKAPKRMAAIEEETDEEEIQETASDDPADFDGEEESFEEEEETEAKTVTKEDALKALQAYAKKHNRDKAMTILKKYAKSGAVKDVPPAKYGDLVNALAV